MKVGDLVYDDHYGYGIVLEIEAREYTIHFQKAPAGTTVVMDEHWRQSPEVISESR